MQQFVDFSLVNGYAIFNECFTSSELFLKIYDPLTRAFINQCAAPSKRPILYLRYLFLTMKSLQARLYPPRTECNFFKIARDCCHSRKSCIVSFKKFKLETHGEFSDKKVIPWIWKREEKWLPGENKMRSMIMNKSKWSNFWILLP